MSYYSFSWMHFISKLLALMPSRQKKNYSSTNSSLSLSNILLQSEKSLPSISLGVRESMYKSLPIWVQPILTSLTSKPYQGEVEFTPTTKYGAIFRSVCSIGLGVLISKASITYSDRLLACSISIFGGWCLTLHGMRMLRLTIEHACAHHAVFSNRFLNRLLGEFISILTVTRSFLTYQKAHTKIHHTHHLLSAHDETYEYLINMVRLKPDMNVSQMWRHLWTTLVSPEFHLRAWLQRCKGCFASPYVLHNVVAVCGHDTQLSIRIQCILALVMGSSVHH